MPVYTHLEMDKITRIHIRTIQCPITVAIEKSQITMVFAPDHSPITNLVTPQYYAKHVFPKIAVFGPPIPILRP